MEITATQLDVLSERIRSTPKPLLAARIKDARADQTLDGLGERLGGVSRQHLIKLEKGMHRPRASMLVRIAEATDRDVEWFLAPEVANDTAPFRVRDGE